MCCLALTAGFLAPRLALFIWWVFEQGRRRVRHLDLAAPRPDLPAVGRRLAYVLAWGPINAVSGAGWLLAALGLAADIATYSSRAAKNRYQTAY